MGIRDEGKGKRKGKGRGGGNKRRGGEAEGKRRKEEASVEKRKGNGEDGRKAVVRREREPVCRKKGERGAYSKEKGGKEWAEAWKEKGESV